jgi:general secretion pathway protein G
MNPRNLHNGFTLIEIMVVVVILGVLGALIVPNVLPKVDQAKYDAAKADIAQIQTALGLYKLDNGKYPSTDQGLNALVEKPTGFPEPKNWGPEPYLPKTPVDPWDSPYYYFSEGNQIEVYTYGADGVEGGEGYDADLSSKDL